MSNGLSPAAVVRASWFPLAGIMLCQIQVSFNAFNVSIEGLVEDLGIPATSVGLGLTTGTFAMAGSCCSVLESARRSALQCIAPHAGPAHRTIAAPR